MSELANRKRVTTSISIPLSDALDRLSKKSRIPKSKLFDEAIEMLLEHHKEKNIDVGEEEPV